MNRLYVFAIGGSGERVMKSLVMALAAGVKVNASEIVPVFIDNDSKSDALRSCRDLIDFYRSDTENEKDVTLATNVGLHQLTKPIGSNPAPSFAQTVIAKPVFLDVAGSSLSTLRDLIGAKDTSNNPIENAIIAERDLLYSDEELDMRLDAGFYARPNVGSLVLSRLCLRNKDFNSILSKIGDEDGVFVIGSLFGGTGAAGFPLLVNKFHEKNAFIGGVALLPYFGHYKEEKSTRQNDASTRKIPTIDEVAYAPNSRSALVYYDEYMDHMHYQYYIGDNLDRTRYLYDTGDDEGQKGNYSNIIELIAAMTIVDFAKQHKVANQSIIYKIPIWRFDNNNVSTAFEIPNPDLRRALVKFQMMKILFENDNFLKSAIDSDKKSPYVNDIGFTGAMLDSVRDPQNTDCSDAWGLSRILKAWDSWMSDLLLCNKKLNIFDKDQVKTLSPNELTKYFTCRNGGFGIAKKAEQHGLRLPFFSSSNEPVACPPDVNQKLQDIGKRLKISTSSEWTNKPLRSLITEISMALDRVLDETCLPDF